MTTNPPDQALTVSRAGLLPRRREPGRLDANSMRSRNRSMLLRSIWRDGPTSRADLARHTGLSRSAVSALVEPLIDSGLVEETGRGSSRGGRRPRMLRFVDEAFSVVGIDMGATHISVVVTDMRGRVRAWQRTDRSTREDPHGALQVMRQLVDAARADTGMRTGRMQAGRLLGVGVAVPSPVDPTAPGRLPPFFMPAWRDIDLERDLALSGSPPLLIDNDANLGALAESWWGAGRDGGDLAFIKLGTGIGAGFVIDGHIFRGHNGTAGEIGHLVIDPQGPQCVCGLQGCLSTFIGTPALLAAARAAGSGEPHSLLDDPALDVRRLIAAVQQGDPAARALIERAAGFLGLAVAGLINLINPRTVVLGGELATVGDALLLPLRARVQSRSMWTAVAHSRIIASRLGEQDVALGAATRVMQAALMDPTRFPVEVSP